MTEEGSYRPCEKFEINSLCNSADTISIMRVKYNNNNNKGKSVPLQAWSGPEGSRKLRFPDYMTTAQDSGKVVSLTHRLPLPPGNTSGTHLC
jgi:hypothetical protein